MFAILESLLVVENREPTCTITKQLQSKIVLLNNYLDLEYRLNFNGIFKKKKKELKPKDVIYYLYNYRSSIAHGKFLDLNSDEVNNVKEFIHLLLRRILKLALKKSQLIADLKNC